MVSLAERIEACLPPGRWVHRNEIVKAIGTTRGTVISEISRMNENGWEIIGDGHNYRRRPQLVRELLMSRRPMHL